MNERTKLTEEVEIVAALVAGLAKRCDCTEEDVLEAIAETLENRPVPGMALRLVDSPPAA
jgi:hypothetical protein